MAGNTNFSTLVTTTLQNFGKEIFDNVITNNVLLNILKSSGNIKVVSGGRQFTHPLRHAQNNTFAARGQYEAIPLTIQDHITRSTWSIRIVDGSVAVSQLELAMNAGDKEKLIDLMEELKDSAEASMSETMGDQVLSTALGTNDMDSIPTIISSTVSTDTTNVGGISSSSTGNSYWRNATYATTVSAFGTSQNGLNAMDTLLNRCVFGREGPTVIITTSAIYTLYQLALTANARYTQMQTGDGGFRNLMYTNIPVYFDSNAPASQMFFINTNALKLQVLAQGNFMTTEMQQTQDALTQSALMYFFGNITTGDRRTSGVINSITG